MGPLFCGAVNEGNYLDMIGEWQFHNSMTYLILMIFPVNKMEHHHIMPWE